MRYGVTGVTRLNAYEEWYVVHTFARLYREGVLVPGDVIVSGCAHGVDTLATGAGLGVELVVPQAPHNAQLVSLGRTLNWTIIEASPGSTRVDAYMRRNDLLVERSEAMIAFPSTLKEALRSGTWATVRRARRKGIQVRLQPLDVAYTAWKENHEDPHA